VREHYSHLDVHFVVQERALGQAHAVWQCRDFLDGGEILLAFGDGVVKADFAGLPRPDADATFTVDEVEDPRSFGVVVLDEEGYATEFIEKPSTLEHKKAIAGINWFRDSHMLRDAIQIVLDEQLRTKGEYYMVDAYRVMLEQGARITTSEVVFWLDAGQPDNLLYTNRRLLALGYASEDALERSFGEGFTVVPPVFLHPDCDIESSVVGPFTSVGPGVTIRGSVVRNSVIDQNASIETVILDGALVGENVEVSGKAKTVFIGDDSKVELG
jgi:glucose-1-phosphate thymidylyltransferase